MNSVVSIYRNTRTLGAYGPLVLDPAEGLGGPDNQLLLINCLLFLSSSCSCPKSPQNLTLPTKLVISVYIGTENKGAVGGTVGLPTLKIYWLFFKFPIIPTPPPPDSGNVYKSC